MKKVFFLLIFVGFFSLFSQGQNASFYLHTQGQKIVDSKGENVLLKGIGLGGYMVQEGYMLKIPFKQQQQHVIKEHIQELIGEEKTEEFYKAWRTNFIQKEDVDSLKSWGFNSIRLPMHYNLFTLSVEEEPIKGKNTWKKEGFERIDSLVSWCKANTMYLILDMHATPGGQGHDLNISDRDPSKPSLWESKANQKKLIALWTKLAEKYKNEPVIGAYDIINEPNWTFQKGKNKNGTQDTENKPLRELMIKITKAIRTVDKNHIIIIEGNGWGNNYNGIFPPWDDNMVMSFHKYWNYNTQDAIQQFLDYRKKYNLPIWLGESGENSNAWFADAISLMEKNNIGWCWWPYKKLGGNNPVQIKSNLGYQRVLHYWKGYTEKPSSTEAYNAFMQLAENTKIENCIIHPDVIDAMIRQPSSNKTLPFKKVLIKSNAEIPAADYDLGNNSVAYQDKVAANYWVSEDGNHKAWNNGGAYRNDGVDIFEKNNTIYVGDMEAGEWMLYTFTIENAAKYQLSFQISSEKNNGKAAVEINGDSSYNLNIPNTSESWSTLKLDHISLKKGKNQLKFKIINGGFKFEKIGFQQEK